MFVHVNAPHRSLIVIMAFPEFLQGPVMSHLCAVNNDCEPRQILLDYLPDHLAELDDTDALAQAVEEACVLACNNAPKHDGEAYECLNVRTVKLEPEDLAYVRQQFLPNHGLRLLKREEAPLPVA